MKPPPLQLKTVVNLDRLSEYAEKVVDILAVIHSIGEVEEVRCSWFLSHVSVHFKSRQPGCEACHSFGGQHED